MSSEFNFDREWQGISPGDQMAGEARPTTGPQAGHVRRDDGQAESNDNPAPIIRIQDTQKAGASARRRKYHKPSRSASRSTGQRFNRGGKTGSIPPLWIAVGVAGASALATVAILAALLNGTSGGGKPPQPQQPAAAPRSFQQPKHASVGKPGQRQPHADSSSGVLKMDAQEMSRRRERLDSFAAMARAEEANLRAEEEVPKSAPQEPPRPTGGKTAARFKQLDANNDGKLSPEEAPQPAIFKVADGDKDGFVTPEELQAYFSKRRSTADGDAKPASAETLFRRAELPGLTDTPVAVNGLAIADLNHDGLPDIIATRQMVSTGWRAGQELPHDRLDVLVNRGGMQFDRQEITITGSALTPEKFGGSAEVPNLADFNGDGFLDIFVTRSGGTRNQKHGNTLLLSDGGWDTFRDVSAAIGVQNLDGYNRQSSIGDVNGDGWLDIAIGCDTIGRPDRFGAPHSRLFVFVPESSRHSPSAVTADGTRSVPATFLDGHFEDIGGTDLVPDFGGYTGDPEKDKAGPGITLRDLDNDGDLDLVQTYHSDMAGAFPTDREATANYAQGVRVWKNLLRETEKLRFERVTDNGLAEYGRIRWDADKQLYEPVAVGSGLPYVAMADTDNDGLLDILAVGPNSTFWAPRAEYTGGRFWRNLGGFRFQRATADAGFESLDWTYEQIYEFNQWPMPASFRDTSPGTAPAQAMNQWGCNRGNLQPGIPMRGPGGANPYLADAIFGDFDNDGWIDVVVLDRRPGMNAFTRLYRNDGRGNFQLLKTAETGLDAGGIAGEAADLNGDGWLDLVFAADPGNTPGGTKEPETFQSKVFLNTGASGSSARHWLRLTFKGITDAQLIGAGVELTANGKKQYRWIYSNHSYKSGGALDAHFGLGQANKAEVTVKLLDGKTKTFSGITADKTHQLTLGTP